MNLDGKQENRKTANGGAQNIWATMIHKTRRPKIGEQNTEEYRGKKPKGYRKGIIQEADGGEGETGNCRV